MNLNNEGGSTMGQILNVTYMFIGVTILTALTSYLEKWCLNGFAGMVQTGEIMVQKA